jgi:hypothetical protein
LLNINGKEINMSATRVTAEERSAMGTLNKFPPTLPLHEIPSVHRNVPLDKVEETTRKIQAKYESTEFFYRTVLDNLTKRTLKNECRVITPLFDSRTVLKTVVKGTAIGAGIGFVFGGVAGVVIGIITKPPVDVSSALVTLGSAAKMGGIGCGCGAGGGAAIGAAIGALVAVKKAKKAEEVRICQRPEIRQWMEEWKIGERKERYDLFLNSLKKHLGGHDALLGRYKEVHGNDAFSSIARPTGLGIPTIPVRSPNGHVYEKEMIEAHLDLRWTAIEEEERNLRESGYGEDRIRTRIAELHTTVCPMRGDPFRKEDLRYAFDFVEQLTRNLRAIRDSELQPIIDRLVEHYTMLDNSVVSQVSVKLALDLRTAGVSEKRILIAVNALNQAIILRGRPSA